MDNGRPDQARRSRARAVAGVCLVLPMAALTCVPLYARQTPRLVGVPFFYWYQFAWVAISVICMLIAYHLRRRHHRRETTG